MANAYWQQTMAELPAEQSTHWMKWLHPEDSAQTRKAWLKAILHHNVFRHNVRLAVKEGDYRWFVVYSYIVADTGYRIVTFLKPISCRKTMSGPTLTGKPLKACWMPVLIVLS